MSGATASRMANLDPPYLLLDRSSRVAYASSELPNTTSDSLQSLSQSPFLEPQSQLHPLPSDPLKRHLMCPQQSKQIYSRIPASSIDTTKACRFSRTPLRYTINVGIFLVNKLTDSFLASQLQDAGTKSTRDRSLQKQ